MKDKIFLIMPDKTLQELEATAYVREDLLQRLLSEYPDLLAGYQMNESNPRRWLLVAREMGIADDLDASERWSLDHLFLDQDGTPTMVEVKRATDTRIRREVAGQMLDYAANAILHWSPEVVRQRFEKRCEGMNLDPAEAVARFLEIDPSESEKIESYWDTVFNKLKTGQVRLVFVADQIPKELRRIIEFLNEHMQDVEVLGVEMPQYVGAGLTTIVPKVIGKTSVAEQTKSLTGGRQWDEASFFSEIEELSRSNAEVARRLLNWAQSKEKVRVEYGTGGHGSMTVKLDLKKRTSLFSIYNYSNGPKIELQLIRLAEKAPFDDVDRRHEVIQRLNQIEGVNLPVDFVHGKRPGLQLDMFRSDDSFDKFTALYNWIIDELRRNEDTKERV